MPASLYCYASVSRPAAKNLVSYNHNNNRISRLYFGHTKLRLILGEWNSWYVTRAKSGVSTLVIPQTSKCHNSNCPQGFFFIWNWLYSRSAYVTQFSNHPVNIRYIYANQLMWDTCESNIYCLTVTWVTWRQQGLLRSILI